jgi:hypothetical protein
MKEQTLILPLLMLSILAIPVLSVSASTRTLTISDNEVEVEMILKAIKENGKTTKVDSFKITADNVLQIDDSVIVEDDVKITKARTIDSANNEKKIDVFSGNRISFGGYNPGVYVLDVIVDDMLAYEGLISIGADQNTVNKEITKVNSKTSVDTTVITIFEIPPPTDEPTPPVEPPTDTPTLPAGQTPTAGTEDGKAPPSCTTPDGRPGGITFSEGNLECIPLDSGVPAPPTPPTPSIADLPAQGTGEECFGFNTQPIEPTGDLPSGSDCVNTPQTDSPIIDQDQEPIVPPPTPLDDLFGNDENNQDEQNNQDEINEQTGQNEQSGIQDNEESQPKEGDEDEGVSEGKADSGGDDDEGASEGEAGAGGDEDHGED